MITHRTGNLFHSGAQVLLNPVNMEGVMGAGLALQFKQRYGPTLVDAYRRHLLTKRLHLGRPTIVVAPNGDQIMLFPSKDQWREPSQLAWIEDGLRYIAAHLDQCGITSLAMPLPGCGLGGLKRTAVRPLIIEHLGPIACNVSLYE